MPTTRYDPRRRAVTVRLDNMTDEEARAAFLSLGRFLSDLSDRRFACIGSSILGAVEGSPRACLFCAIDRREGRAVTGCELPPAEVTK